MLKVQLMNNILNKVFYSVELKRVEQVPAFVKGVLKNINELNDENAIVLSRVVHKFLLSERKKEARLVFKDIIFKFIKEI